MQPMCMQDICMNDLVLSGLVRSGMVSVWKMGNMKISVLIIGKYRNDNSVGKSVRNCVLSLDDAMSDFVLRGHLSI